MATNNRIRMALLLTALLALLPLQALADAMDDEVPVPQAQPIDVSLHGLTSFNGVQLFEYLLRVQPGVTAVQQTSMTLVPERPEECRVSWVARTVDTGTGELVERLAETFAGLDPDGQNKVLFEAPFIVAQEDLQMVKNVFPVQVAPRRIDFSLQDVRLEPQPLTDFGPALADGRPWYARPGMGFE